MGASSSGDDGLGSPSVCCNDRTSPLVVLRKLFAGLYGFAIDMDAYDRFNNNVQPCDALQFRSPDFGSDMSTRGADGTMCLAFKSGQRTATTVLCRWNPLCK